MAHVAPIAHGTMRMGAGLALEPRCMQMAGPRTVAGLRGLSFLLCALLLGALGVLSPVARAADQNVRLQVLSEDWPPVSYMEDGRPTGLAVEVVEEMLRRAGRGEKIEFVPWSRGYKLVTEAPNVILFPMARSGERELLVTMLGPLLEVRTELYQRKGGPWLGRIDEAKRKAVVGTYRSNFAATSAARHGFINLALAATPDRSARMLLSGRIDLWADSNLSSASALRKVGGDPAILERVMVLDVNPLMVALSPGTPRGTIDALEKALREMKADGTFQRIFLKWFPSDTPPAGVDRVGIVPAAG